jgi:hypothetical protein
MSRDITWINEISNTTNDDYIMWVWDVDNEGEFKDYNTGALVGRNDGATRVVIKAGAHLRATGCGVPDAGDKNGKVKCRVICKASAAMKGGPTADPGAGLRLNRVMDAGNNDKLSYRNHRTGKEEASVVFPRGNEQNAILRITNGGIFLDIQEQKESTEWKAYEAGQEIAKVLEQALIEIAKLAFQLAEDALLAA